MANKTVLIIGASRGLGLGLAQRFSEAGWAVTATVRSPNGAEALQVLNSVSVESLDMNHPEQISGLAQRLAGQTFDVIFINAGIMGPVGDLAPVTETQVGELFMTNALSPIRVAKALVGQLRPATGVLAFMSSGLGSVQSPDAIEAALYKASKAALNSMVNTLTLQLPEPRPTVLSMHPGWVKTDMGGENAEIDVLTSTSGMLAQLQAWAGKGGHHFINYRGDVLPW
ncbi:MULTISPECIES: SDR family oxidoreductase [unclassified Pseudomonas]|uniref:SDR family oxidoreductase n=1 Tax=unclassified Pseudomonas TaxID=196821 RepID=UPI000BCD9ADA|nr:MULTISPECIES: SDR family oxidoreductase [unclassified Pseudomonas]PVZ09808.1 short-subunit dehydrogenase [Pseudomonas sp. URIL14HWK12:I12]PVZ21436.1 short-subunit dehydrogenase [Pseudomonas sp. URIL14HWK12:I10]PVZ30383.1 short-subunit dehydrogenase [Pseudomonas sp. URIL14HWK12:I11]SNZ18680.1 Short-chain dehydrogenase [Pseudomonas sp. URIL14HWK12:I9]